MLQTLSFILFLTASIYAAPPPPNRVASFYVSEDFINEQLSLHVKSDLMQKMSVALDPEGGQIFLKGTVQVPIEELRAVNLNPKLGTFRFQLTIHPKTTKHGHLILEFPLDETFFYPASSKNPKRDRVIIPVQMLSLALASARGYLAAVSGDFSGFDRRTRKLEGLISSLGRAIAAEKNSDVREDLENERDAARLKLQAVPLERKQLLAVSKEFETMLGFTGEKELSLNEELGAKDNALILKIKLSQLAPYLQGVELGGVRILHDKKDGNGQNYLAIDVNASLLANATAVATKATPAPRPAMKIPPSFIVRLNQSLLESDAVVSAEKKEMPSKLQDFKLEMKDDGVHISGSWHTFLFSVPFDTIVDFVSTDTDKFEVRVQEIKVAGIDFDFLKKFAFEAVKKRLDSSLKGICKFDFVGDEREPKRALQVTVDPKKLVPAMPDLHLVAVDVREREFLLKVGRPG